MSERRYTVQSCNLDGKPVTTSNFTDPEQALVRFREVLLAEGWTPLGADLQIMAWAAVLMKGGAEYTVFDPQLETSAVISVGTTPKR